MKLKRLLATALVFALVLTLSVTALAADASSYYDLPAPGSWNYAALVSAIENGVMSGENGYIKPGELITVGEMYTYAGNALGVTLSAPSGSTNIATREDLFVLLADLVGAELSPYDNMDTYLGGFSDNSSISSSARTPIAALIKAGYITGYVSGSTAMLYPKNQLTRSEFAVLAHRIFGQYVNSAGTVSNDVNGNITIRSSGVTLSGNIITGDVIIGGNTGRTIDLNLNNATVRGRTIVRGPASVYANSRSTVGIVHNYADLTFSGDATTINVRGSKTNIRVSGGELRNLNIESDGNTVTVGSGVEVRSIMVDGSSNDISGSGTVGNASFSGSSNKFDIAGANIVSDTGRNNVTNTKTGNFNVVSAEITSGTTILVTFDANIQTAPASAFTLSGNAKSYTKNSTAAPDNAVINGSSVTLTFTGAEFGNIPSLYGAATITVSDAVIATDKAKLNIKSASSGYGYDVYEYNSTVNFSIVSGKNSGSLTFDGNTAEITTPTEKSGNLPGTIYVKFTVNDPRYLDVDFESIKSVGSTIDIWDDVTVESDSKAKYTLSQLKQDDHKGVYWDTNSKGNPIYIESYSGVLAIETSAFTTAGKTYTFKVMFDGDNISSNGNTKALSTQSYTFRIYYPK